MELFSNESRKRQFGTVLVTAGILLVVFLAVQSIKTLKEYRYIGHASSQPNTITVSGTGEVTAVPDTGTFSFSVVEEAKVSADATDAAAKKMNAIIAALKAAGVDEKDIKTTGYNVYPKYEYQTKDIVCPMNSYCPQQGKQVLTGYEVSQTVQVKVRKTADAGTLLSKVATLGASNVSGLDFVIDDMDAIKTQARDKAIADAKGKAAQLARSLGVDMSRIVSFSESGNGGPIYYDKAVMGAPLGMGNQASVPQLPVGENKVTSNVTITYEIE
jgi:uncharacterized protein